ncbi:MAG: ribose-5-phosphate isomerase RpiA [Candidatus Acidiferrales bacterium]
MDPSRQNQWKKFAAEAAAQLVRDGMVIGLGTGSTAAFFVSALAERISREGLRVSGIPTSTQTAELARSLKVPLASFTEHPELDLTVDGADEVEMGTLYLIKGHGGALLREKIVAAASKRVVIVADETKLVERLGSLYPVPVEIVQFGWEVTDKRLQKLGAITSLRRGADAKPFLTDCGNYIIDCAFGPMNKPKEVAHHLDHVVGLVEHGLFLEFASQVFVGGREGVKVLERKTAAPKN